MRRKTISRITGIALTAMMMVSAAGCAKSSSYEIKTTRNEAEESVEDDTQNTGTTLTVWCWDPAFNISAMNTAGEIYAKDHPDVSLNVVQVEASDIIQKMSTAIKSGKEEDLPDILLMKDSNLSENLDYYDGVFADLTDSGIDYSQFASYKANMGIYQGKHYTVPFDSGAAILCLRQDIIEKAGYTVDDFTDITWSRFIEIGMDVKAKTGYPMLSCQSGSSDFLMLMVQSAGSWLSKDGRAYIYDNQALREAMVTYKQLLDSGVLVEENNWDAYTGSINDGEVAGAMNGCWITSTIMAAEDQSGLWRMTNIPRLDQVENAVNYSNSGGSSWLIIDSSKNKDVAIDFMKSTFGSNVDFYSEILPTSGALATYLPASQSDAYQQPQEFFGNEPIYAKISEFTGHVPSIEVDNKNATVYDRASIYLIDYVGGADLDTVLSQYQQEMDELYAQ
ncbi:MAG: ABC transporter substrate-binding protein [Roseburia sp.]|uniref:ABC transporter substrate-binding protein n=1 Tax=Roseburia sp. 831b TaxID=1261635 RepID=UPI0009524D72|nr:ABC transporter substrate-binding protein [Roseburia sp. 831b]MCI5918670.1 ABC transporter substrate-binding protein [Roseburia sp.]MDD6215216.1 ABC transporter substrate-binding protein [Roseburia sp.]MDY5884537.1 ABC transporter substrate-binding protein [Roseburia sp.]WVK74078.1 ABC transporter substrate-binding protein [Roseburia sp. 831b]